MLETATALESSVASSCRELLPHPTPVPTRSPSLTTVSRRCQRVQAKRFSGTNCVNRISTRHRNPVSFVTLLVVKQLRATFRCSSTTGWDVPISHGQRRRVEAVNLRVPEAEHAYPLVDRNELPVTPALPSDHKANVYLSNIAVERNVQVWGHAVDHRDNSRHAMRVGSECMWLGRVNQRPTTCTPNSVLATSSVRPEFPVLRTTLTVPSFRHLTKRQPIKTAHPSHTHLKSYCEPIEATATSCYVSSRGGLM